MAEGGQPRRCRQPAQPGADHHDPRHAATLTAPLAARASPQRVVIVFPRRPGG
jgi:hypothetical protein